MATTIQQIYDEVILVFWENNGFDNGTGIFTNDQFFKALWDVMYDFLDRTGCVKKVINVPILAGVAVYDEPNTATTVQSAAVSQTYIYQDSGRYLSNFDPQWASESGQPAKWREDGLPPNTIQLAPNPDVEGYQVATNVTGGYGTISSTSAPVDFDIVAGPSQTGYGTISGAPTGPIYLETLNPGYGIINYMVSSTDNLQLYASCIPYAETYRLQDYLEILPDNFTPAIKYGICAKLYGSDSVAKNQQQSEYCSQRYIDFLKLIEAIMDEEEVDIKK